MGITVRDRQLKVLERCEAANKRLAERCSMFIRGAQCDNYRMPDSAHCAVHGRGQKDAAPMLEP